MEGISTPPDGKLEKEAFADMSVKEIERLAEEKGRAAEERKGEEVKTIAAKKIEEKSLEHGSEEYTTQQMERAEKTYKIVKRLTAEIESLRSLFEKNPEEETFKKAIEVKEEALEEAQTELESMDQIPSYQERLEVALRKDAKFRDAMQALTEIEKKVWEEMKKTKYGVEWAIDILEEDRRGTGRREFAEDDYGNFHRGEEGMRIFYKKIDKAIAEAKNEALKALKLQNKYEKTRKTVKQKTEELLRDPEAQATPENLAFGFARIDDLVTSEEAARGITAQEVSKAMSEIYREEERQLKREEEERDRERKEQEERQQQEERLNEFAESLLNVGNSNNRFITERISKELEELSRNREGGETIEISPELKRTLEVLGSFLDESGIREAYDDIGRKGLELLLEVSTEHSEEKRNILGSIDASTYYDLKKSLTDLRNAEGRNPIDRALGVLRKKNASIQEDGGEIRKALNGLTVALTELEKCRKGGFFGRLRARNAERVIALGKVEIPKLLETIFSNLISSNEAETGRLKATLRFDEGSLMDNAQRITVIENIRKEVDELMKTHFKPQSELISKIIQGHEKALSGLQAAIAPTREEEELIVEPKGLRALKLLRLVEETMGREESELLLYPDKQDEQSEEGVESSDE